MAGPRRAYRAILFDLFGTLVFFRKSPLSAPGGAAASAHLQLAKAVASELPEVRFESFVEHVREVSRAIEEARRNTHQECSSPERFHRVLQRLGIDDRSKAERICSAHMRGLTEATEMPPEQRETLRLLAQRFPIGLVSNFDHAPAAREVLRRHGLLELLDPIVISDDFGWRKPKPEIFAHAVAALGVGAEEVLFVGDTPYDDVHGARLAGLDAAWINPRGDAFPPAYSPPVLLINGVPDLLRVL